MAIVSAIGDDFALTRIGLIVFSNERLSEKISLGLDQVAQRTAEQVVRERRPNATLVPVHYDANTLSSRINRAESLQPYADPKRIEPELRDIVRGKPVDTLILLARDRESSGPMALEGVGIYTERTLRERAAITPYAGLSLFVLDARSMETLATARRVVEGAVYNLNPIISSKPLGGPAPFMAGFRFPLSDEQRQFLERPMQDLVAATVRRLLEQTGL